MKRTVTGISLLFGGLVAWSSACGFSTSGLGGTGAASWGTAAGGKTGASTGGAAGGNTGGASATSTTSSSGTGGGCPTGFKACGGGCVSTGDPAFGCASAGCDPCASATNGTTACDGSGACTITCNAPFAECDGLPGTACETDTSSSPGHCGACDHACPGPAGQATCSGGMCGLTCTPGLADCNGDPNDGCERLVTTTTDCGACNHACANPHGTTVCLGGTCAPTCDPGFADCNGDPSDGCERNIVTITDCGACNHACPAGFNCPNGLCGCAANNANCDAGGAPAGSFSCMPLTGPDVCVCNGVICEFGQRCQSDGHCG